MRLRINIQRMTEVQFSVGFNRLFTPGSEFWVNLNLDGTSKSPQLQNWTGSLLHKLLKNWSLEEGTWEVLTHWNESITKWTTEILLRGWWSYTSLKSCEKRVHVMVIFLHCGILFMRQKRPLSLLLCKHFKKIMQISHLPVRTERDE